MAIIILQRSAQKFCYTISAGNLLRRTSRCYNTIKGNFSKELLLASGHPCIRSGERGSLDVRSWCWKEQQQRGSLPLPVPPGALPSGAGAAAGASEGAALPQDKLVGAQCGATAPRDDVVGHFPTLSRGVRGF